MSQTIDHVIKPTPFVMLISHDTTESVLMSIKVLPQAERERHTKMVEEKTSDSEGNNGKATGDPTKVKSEEKPSIFNLEQSLMSSLKTLYEKQIACDITIVVGKDSARQEFKAHKCLLCIQSPYFHKIFLGNELSIEEDLSLYPADETALVLENVSPSAFTIIIKLVVVDTSKIITYSYLC